MFNKIISPLEIENGQDDDPQVIVYIKYVSSASEATTSKNGIPVVRRADIVVFPKKNIMIISHVCEEI